MSLAAEYGGYLPIDIYGTEYYNEESVGGNVLCLNSARNAIAVAVEDGEYDKVWLPVYTCESVYTVLRKEGISISTYNINEKLEPLISRIDEKDCIVITNYFGIKNHNFYEEMCNRYNNIIFDNTQSFFAVPILKEHVYNVYSPRKFVGVSDGAYLISKSPRRKKVLVSDYSAERAAYLLKSLEQGTNYSYNEYLRGEEELSSSGIRLMSKLTHMLLSNVRYDIVSMKRKENFKKAHELLGGINELKFDFDDEICPMVYPLVVENGMDYRKYLVSNKIYVPQWWKWVLDIEQSNDVEKKLSNYLYPIPIDQRYDVNVIEKICKIVKEYKGGLYE